MDYLYCEKCKKHTAPRARRACPECKTLAESFSKSAHRGVKVIIDKEIRVGSNFRIDKEGSVKDRKPDYDIWYTYHGGSRHFTRKELIETIDGIFSECYKQDISDELIREVMNDPEAGIPRPN